MMSSRVLCAAALLLLAACSTSNDRPDPALPGGGTPGPSQTPGNPPGATPLPGGAPGDNLVEVSRMSSPTFIELLEIRARDDQTHPGVVYFCSGVQGFGVVDARVPAAMDWSHRVGASLGDRRYPRCQHLTWSGERLFFSSRGDEIQPRPFIASVVIEDGQPRELDIYTEGLRSFEGMAASGSFVLSATHEQGLLILESTADGSLRKHAELDGFENAMAVAVRGELAVVADGAGGLVTVSVADMAAPRILGRVDTGGIAVSVELSEDGPTAAVAASNAGLVMVDLSDPAAPTLLGSHDTPGTALQVSLSGTRALIADWDAVVLFDISDASAPRLLSHQIVDVFGPFSRVLGAAIRGDDIFVGEWTGLYAYRFEAGKVGPELHVQTHPIDFGPVEPGEIESLALRVDNFGQAPLSVEASIEDMHFSVSPARLELAPGEADVFELAFAPGSRGSDDARLILESNDPDEDRVRIDLAGNQDVAGVGAEAPESVVQLLEGGEWRLSDQRGQVVVLAYFATF